MKAALSLWMLCASLAVLAAPAPPSQLERFSISGREYVRVGDWARLNGFQGAWLSNQEFVLTNKFARLSFTVDVQKFSFNGTLLWLSVPIALRNGTAFIAPVDLQTTIQPLLRPKRNAPGLRVKVICLDPGHGGKDTGNAEGKQFEKEYTLLLARELSTQLRKAGYKVFLTRSWDTFVELDERPEIARTRKADLFISLHFNAAAGDARGAEVYCLTPSHTASTNARGEGAENGSYVGNAQNEKNVLLAYQLQKSLIARLGMEDRGVRRARWAVLRPARMPAVLVEGGFMSNAPEVKKIYSAAWRKQLASAIVEGVKSYARSVDPAK